MTLVITRKFVITPICINLHKNQRIMYFSLTVPGSILFYPITLEGRRGTTDEFATIPFHPDLFSAALVELAKSIPAHSLILSSHHFFCLPLFLFPFIVLCRIVFSPRLFFRKIYVLDICRGDSNNTQNV